MAVSSRFNRRSLILTGPALAALATLTGGAAPSPKPHFTMTPLGRAFLALLPAEGLASWLDVNTTDVEWVEGYDKEWDEEIDRRGDEAWGRIKDAVAAIHVAARGNPLAHLADLAVVARYRQIEWNGFFADGSDEGECEEDDHEDSSLLLLTRSVLVAAGISEDSLNAEMIHQAEGAKHHAQCGTCPSCRNFAKVEAKYGRST